MRLRSLAKTRELAQVRETADWEAQAAAAARREAEEACRALEDQAATHQQELAAQRAAHESFVTRLQTG